MLIHQAQQLKNNSIVYDILHREYRIIGYSFQYSDGLLSNILFQLKNIKDSTVLNGIEYKYLYTCLDELSDPELAFYQYVLENKPSLPLDFMPIEQLDAVAKIFIGGFWKGRNSNDDQ